MLFRKKVSKNYLSFIPTRKIQEFSESDGKISLLVPKFKNERFGKWFIPKHKSIHFKIHLDELGSQVWWLIDGNRSVEEICNLLNDFLNTHHKPADQLEERVTRFLTDLHRNGFVSFSEAQSRLDE
jgi:Coenzyme PQQ synthesis protein D (PqqD).